MKNHGVPAQLIERHFDVQRRFFRLPLEDKLSIRQDANNRQGVGEAELGRSACSTHSWQC